MDFKLVKLFFILLHILVSSQDLEISSKYYDKGCIEIEIMNTSKKEIIFYFDKSNITFDCINVNSNNIVSQNFLAPNICINNKKNKGNWYIPEIVKIIYGEPRYGKNINLNLSQYLDNCKLIFKPFEKKNFTFNINELEIYQGINGFFKTFPVNAKIMLFHIEIVEGKIVYNKTLLSNEFKMRVKMLKD